MNEAVRTTCDHDEIRAWVEAHEGTPCHVPGTGGDGLGVLRLSFPADGLDEMLRPVTWAAWFTRFEADGLALQYEPEMPRGGRPACALVARSRAPAV